MLCAISGEAPQVPVASKNSGAVFEKRLIDAYIAENGKDPITNEPLAAEDLIELRADRTVKPRPPQMTSIPPLLAAFQNEWDALALERFSIQQQLEQTRRELSRALYENDAATRVIARIQKERDEARDALSKLSINGGAGGDVNGMHAIGQNLPSELVSAVTETQASLSSTRRKRPVPEDWVSAEEIGAFKSQKLDEAGAPTSRFIAQHPSRKHLLHSAGQPPGSVAVFDVEQSSATSLDTAQDGQLTDAVWTPKGSIFTGSATGNVCLRGVSNANTLVRQSHKGEVTSVSTHASGRILASTSTDKTFIFYDLNSGTPVTQISTEAALTTGAFHPDGHLFAAGGADGEIKIYETLSGARAATFSLGGPVRSFVFSENGTWLAASVEGDSNVQIWDLRKGAMVHTVQAAGAVSSLDWDYTGQFLAAAGTEGVIVHQYQKASKAWTETLRASTPAVTLAWGSNAKTLSCIDASGTLFELA